MISKPILPVNFAQLIFVILCSCGITSNADTIDSILGETQAAKGVEPTVICDDATFLRRLSLDLLGRVPSTTELSSFLRAPNRELAVERYLSSIEHVQYWSSLWTTMLVGRTQQEGVEPELLRVWLEEQLSSQTPINQIAFDLISAEGVSALNGPVNFVVSSRSDPAMRVSRTFLAIQLDCARCHDHPHDRWTMENYKGMEKFFRPVQYKKVSGGVSVADRHSTDKNRPVFLSGRKPQTTAWRRELALMIVQSKTFSRAMTNRTWSWLMGRGLVDPVDGFSRDNEASVPQLLESLAQDFRENSFDHQKLIRKICLSKAYQRERATESSSKADLQRELFAARNVRQMTPEQWTASSAIVLGQELPTQSKLREKSAKLLGVSNQAEQATDAYRWTATSQTIVRELSGPVTSPLQSLDSLYLAVLARKPTEDERKLTASFTPQETLFALMHSNEFVSND